MADVLTGNVSDTQSLNRYTYCKGNPVKYTDPSGMSPEVKAQKQAELEKEKREKVHNVFDAAGIVSTPAKHADDIAEVSVKYGSELAENVLRESDEIGGVVKGVSNPKVVRDGAARAAEYSKNWRNASLNDVIKEYAPNSIPTTTASGKTIYTDSKTGIQIVHDTKGNYFRIEDTNKVGKRRYLGLDGKDMSNKVQNGKQIGRSKAEYEWVTHFNNID
ncbi:MAG: hypothetical protein Q4F95_13100 [Oscillospiraceae bacterium]|nr:hypothetical protein [Oscillospiraceae bacterium]